MKLKTIKANSFGRLRGWESPCFDKNLVLVYGSNEAGKSTLFNLITTLFYGWSPATRDNNPYAPWDGTPASIEAVLVTDNEREISVHRRLRSRPEGTLIDGNTTLNLRNDALAQLISVPREIFVEVYALTADQMRFPDPGAWQRVQDQLLGGQYASFLRPVRDVINELDNEARRLWHTDRRSGIITRELQEKIRELTQKRQEAQENEEALRRIEGRLADLNQEREHLLIEKTRVTTYLIRSQRLLPVRKKIRRIEELKLLAGDVAAYDHLPGEPQQALNELEQKISGLEKECQLLLDRKKSLEIQLASFTSEDRSVLAQKERIKSVAKSYTQIGTDRQALEDLEIELERCRDRLHDRAKDTLQGGWKPELEAVVKSIDEMELRAGIESFKRAEAQCQKDDAKVEGLRVRAAGRKLPASTPWAAAVLFLLGLTGMFVAGSSPLGFFAVLLALLGCVLGLACWFLKGGGTGDAELREAENRLAGSRELCQEARHAVAAALKGLPVAPLRLETPEESLLLDINKIKDLVNELEDSIKKKDIIARRLKESEGTVEELLCACRLSSRPDILENIRQLEERLNEAEERSRNAADAENNLKEIEPKLSSLETNINGLEKDKRVLLDSLDRLSGYDLQEKINNLKQRRACLQQARALEEDLMREHPDLEEIKGEIRRAEDEGETWIFDDQEIAQFSTRREQIESRLNDLHKEIGILATELKQRQEQERLDDIEGAMAELEAEQLAVAVKRDRLVLLKNLLIEADRRFREEHQPDVLQKAGRYLDVITGGRYDRLFMRDDGDQGLLVRSNYYDYPLEVGPPLSRGTLQQIFLALRLALVDHLDAGGECLPLFLDEILVNWDGNRLENGLNLLKDIVGQRQVFLFTCHQWLNDRILEVTEAQVIALA